MVVVPSHINGVCLNPQDDDPAQSHAHCLRVSPMNNDLKWHAPGILLQCTLPSLVRVPWPQVDATVCGGAARFINHSCEVCTIYALYTLYILLYILYTLCCMYWILTTMCTVHCSHTFKEQLR